ncbi:ATP-dependent zinc metalloprotease FtsH [Rhodovastum atsumiense]|uniref:ATP-dependent zinc metalloprotease FtsH n=1 Tax=Rhodovastum atsumiense TaxID=504468 RepID=A0A5M6IPE6_9PROT|nr:ATP-dependent zinc metalloprotease FtsH [Rhodovastum atsumiense]KAA5609335.1 ATP-dependent metallopeptidase FtsH/Yme1/Tma family protein [Rhodovastum atsumiense]CAH2602363.1 ATP-dependent zinc metalloprotease FtsH [Rhodovastum atsumiense]
MTRLRRSLLVGAILSLLTGMILLVILQVEPGTSAAPPAMAYSDFLDAVKAGRVHDVTLQGHAVTGHLRTGEPVRSYMPDDPALLSRLDATGVKVDVVPEQGDSVLSYALYYLLSWAPVLLLVGVWVFFMRQAQSGGGAAMGFRKSRARLLTEAQGHVTFADVAGIDEARGELQEIVDFLKDPERFQLLGGKIPRGVLLVGPPGTGKTLLARAIAGEARVPFFSISGSDFVEMFVGVGASRVRDMFEQGRKKTPCIIFIDEIDAVGRHRGKGLGGGNDEREQTLNQILVEMDGFDSSDSVILIAATNRPDVLDPALLRPGRFDRQVVVPNPDVNGRQQILGVHVRKVPLAADVDTRVIARGTPGFSGADLANLVNEAALLAARQGAEAVTMAEFETARDKVLMGAERRSLVMSEAEKRMTAYHEAGHALCALHEPECDPVHKATIIPRGRALGLVMSLPEGDRYSKSKSRLLAELTMAMGGRAAEEIIFGADKVSNGAAGDIRMATDQARRMVTEWGMSDRLGLIAYGDNSQEMFLGHSVTQTRNVSEATARAIDAEVKAIIDAAYARAKDVLVTHLGDLHRLARGLLEYETLSGEEIRSVLRGERVIRRPPPDASPIPAPERPALPMPPPGLEPLPQPG